jgi:alpha-tubulin suppressor-like RCC1 family protein
MAGVTVGWFGAVRHWEAGEILLTKPRQIEPVRLDRDLLRASQNPANALREKDCSCPSGYAAVLWAGSTHWGGRGKRTAVASSKRSGALVRRVVGLLAVGLGLAAGPASAASPPPEIESFRASPSSLGSAGGSVVFSARVTLASGCKLSATPTFKGLPATMPCTKNGQWPAVFVPSNVTATAVTYQFVLTATGLLGAASTTSSPITVTVAPAPPATYVAVGDSYASGEGNPGKASTPWVDREGKPTSLENGCDRSAAAYPMLLTKWLGSRKNLPSMSLEYLACSGAGTEDLWGSGAQASGLKGPAGREPQQLLDTAGLRAARIVTVSVGGDDLNFADILKGCTFGECDSGSSDPWIRDLGSHIAALEPVLIRTYQQIEREAPNAALYVVGYPDIFPPNPTPEQLEATCPAATSVPGFGITTEGIEYLVANQRLLTAMIERATLAAGARFIDPNAPGAHSYLGHDICEGKLSWFVKPSIHVAYSYHPTKPGQAAFSALLQASIAKYGGPPPSGPYVGAGGFHTCAVRVAGELECWGRNDFGQLGNGTVSCSSCANDLPQPVSGLSDPVRAVFGGVGHTCALLISAAVECWGANQYGQLGDGGTAGSFVPVPVGGALTAAAQVTAGAFHVCALAYGSGEIYCWGEDQYGQLGDASTANSSEPRLVSGVSDASAVAAGMGGYSTCAIRAGGTVYCWGQNQYGQLGNGTTTQATTPTQVQGISGALAITGGERQFCALLGDGTLRCWGNNQWGQLGNGTTTNSAKPVKVNGITKAVAIAAGYHSACALLASGTVDCWGENQYGQLGSPSLGFGGQSSTPVTVQGLPGAPGQITAGAEHMCAQMPGQATYCWGRNGFGQLGDGESTDTFIPEAVQLGL